MKLVSIIIPCHNYGWLLAETLDSVLAQTYPHWECLIIDDGSTDDTKAVATGYQRRDARFNYFFQPSQGVSAARNVGLRAARGEYVQFLDADDLLAPRKLEIQVNYLETHSAIDLTYGDVRYFRHGAPGVLAHSFDMHDQPWVPEVPATREELLVLLVRQNIMVINAALTRTSLIQKVGLFNESLRSMEDWEYWFRCAWLGGRMHFSPDPAVWALVRVHPTSASNNFMRMNKANLQMRAHFASWLRQTEFAAAQQANEQAITDLEASIGRYHLAKGNIVTGTRGFITAARRSSAYGYYLKSWLYWLSKRARGQASR